MLVSNTKVVSQIIINNNIGYVTDTHNPKELAKIVNNIFENNIQYNQWLDNLCEISNIYTWENESKKLIEIFENIEYKLWKKGVILCKNLHKPMRYITFLVGPYRIMK